jgi:hypothetical protein
MAGTVHPAPSYLLERLLSAPHLPSGFFGDLSGIASNPLWELHASFQEISIATTAAQLVQEKK